jgi:hypothetical protein
METNALYNGWQMKALTLCMLVGASSMAVQQPCAGEEALRKGTWHLRQGAPFEALPLLSSATQYPGLACSETRAIANNNLGLASFLNGDSSLALEYLDSALAFRTHDDIALRNLAWVRQASPSEMNHDAGFIGEAYEHVISIELIRLLLHLSRSGEPKSYDFLLHHLLRHFNVQKFERTDDPGAASWIKGYRRLDYIFDIKVVHVGNGTGLATVLIEQQTCDGTASSAGSASTTSGGGTCEEISLDPPNQLQLSIFELGFGERLCGDPFHLQPFPHATEGMEIPRERETLGPSALFLHQLKSMLTGLFDSRYTAVAMAHPHTKQRHHLSSPEFFITLAMPLLAQLESANIDLSPYPGSTLSSIGMMNQLQVAIEALLAAGTEGDLMETGVWRGGLCVWMLAVMQAVEAQEPTRIPPLHRLVWAADSFEGVPPPRSTGSFAQDETHEWVPHLYAADIESVRWQFERLSLGNTNSQLVDPSRVRFVKGYFNESLRPAVNPVIQTGRRLALLRLDGDTYESTMDVLAAMYTSVNEGGYIIVDDFHLNGCRRAVFEFRQANGITAPLMPIPEDYVYSCSRRAYRAPPPSPEWQMPFHIDPRKPVQGVYWVKER